MAHDSKKPDVAGLKRWKDSWLLRHVAPARVFALRVQFQETHTRLTPEAPLEPDKLNLSYFARFSRAAKT